jgi:hypothetical protein
MPFRHTITWPTKYVKYLLYLFEYPKAYEPVLGVLPDVVSEQLGSQESAALLTGVGRRMAEWRGALVGGDRARLEEAVAGLNELGGLAELEERDGASSTGATAARWLR